MKLDLPGMCNGILCGLVSICAGVDVFTPGTAIGIGVLAGFAYEGCSNVVWRLGIDDPVDAFSVHGAGGILGLLARALFDPLGCDSEILAGNVLGAVCIMAWSGVLTALIFVPLKVIGGLTVSDDEQAVGGDLKVLGRNSYSPPASPKVSEIAPQSI